MHRFDGPDAEVVLEAFLDQLDRMPLGISTVLREHELWTVEVNGRNRILKVDENGYVKTLHNNATVIEIQPIHGMNSEGPVKTILSALTANQPASVFAFCRLPNGMIIGSAEGAIF